MPFALLVIGALLQPDIVASLRLNQVKATIWGAAIMVCAALVLAPHSSRSRAVANISELYWSFGLLIFLFHVYLAAFLVFDGIVDTVRHQGSLAVGKNVLLIGWWCLDVVLIWSIGYSRREIRVTHYGAQVFVFLVFAHGLLAHEGRVQMLGLVLTMGVLASLAIRLVVPESAVEARATRHALERSITPVRGGRRKWFTALLERERGHAQLLLAPIGRGEIRPGRAEARMQSLGLKLPLLPPR